MKRSHQAAALGLLFVYALAGLGRIPLGEPPAREQQWQKVAEARRAGLPKTAADLLGPIAEQALRDKDYPAAIKAVATKVALEGQVEGRDGAAEKVNRMREAVAAAPAEMRPLMNAILAHWWWEFYQQSAWRFANRSATSEVPGPDIRTWDAPRIFAEIGRTFDAALAAEKELKAVPIGSYGFLLEKGSLPDRYRLTLYDFLAFDALGFYTSADDGVRKDGRDVGATAVSVASR